MNESNAEEFTLLNTSLHMKNCISYRLKCHSQYRT